MDASKLIGYLAMGGSLGYLGTRGIGTAIAGLVLMAGLGLVRRPTEPHRP